MDYLQCVKEFRETAGLEHPLFATTPTLLQKTFIISMIMEEIEEFREALELGSGEGQLDALVDCSYFVLSGCLELGWEGFISPGIPILTPTIPTLYRLEEKMKNNFTPSILNHIFNYCKKLGGLYGDFDGAFVCVHAANMSKFDSTEQKARCTRNRYKKIGVESYTIKAKRFFVTKRSSDDKILKSNLWEEPNLTPFLHSTPVK
jgi:hypothetical protein